MTETETTRQPGAAVHARRGRRRQLYVLLGLIMAIASGGLLISVLPDKVDLQQSNRPSPPEEQVEVPPLPATKLPEVVPADEDASEHVRSARERELALRFQQAASMLHMGQYDYAIAALHRVLEIAPELPEAHVNMGFALLGLEQYQAALDFFNAATELRPDQANAYYGMGLALEGLGELRGAMGAMRTFTHLSREDSEHIRRARSALWEWETILSGAEIPQSSEVSENEKVGVADTDAAQPSSESGAAPSDQSTPNPATAGGN